MDSRLTEFDVAGMVWVLPALSRERIRGRGRLGPYASSQYSAQTYGQARSRSWLGQSTLAERLLLRVWAVQLRSSAREVNPVPDGALTGKPPTGKPDAGDPPVRFGGRGSLSRLSLPLFSPGRQAW